MELHELAMTALRTAGVYILMLLVIRLMGKRTVGMFTAFDLLVALMLGEVVDEIIYGDVTFSQGAVAIGVIALAKYLTSWLSYWDHGFDRILEGKPTVIVQDGKLVRNGLRRERLSEQDVMSELRLNGIDDILEVKLAMIETDGEVSVLKHEWAQPLRKADLETGPGKYKEKGGGKDGVKARPASAA